MNQPVKRGPGNPNLKKGAPSLNPSGRPKETPEQKKIKDLTKREIVEVGNLILKGEVQELQRIASDPTAPALRVALAAVVVKTIATGKMDSLNLLLDRMVGKVKDEVHHTGEVSHPPRIVVMLPDNNRDKVIDVTPEALPPEEEFDLGF